MDAPASAGDAFLARHPEIRWLDAVLPDINGIPRGKRISSVSLGKLFSTGLLLPTSLIVSSYEGETVEETGYGLETGDEDSVCRPILETLAPTLWSDPPAGQVLLSLEMPGGGPVPIDPRTTLKRVVQGLAEDGYTATVAIELECYLIDRNRATDGGPLPPCPPGGGPRLASSQLYGLDDLESFSGVLDGIAQACDHMGIAITTAISEYGPGQIEINLPHGPDPIAACDQAVMFKRAVRGVARQAGIDASFMAKPYADKAGSGMHVHVSLTDRKGNAVFADPSSSCPEPLRHAIGGTLELMEPSLALFVPNLNGFRRLQPNSFAPIGPTWGIDNRTVSVRVPNSDPANRRLEHRLASADANPYLAMAAILAGVRYGLTHKCDPGPVSEGDAYEGQQQTDWDSWALAIERLSNSKPLRDALGDGQIDAYATVKQHERRLHIGTIAPKDYRWHL